MNPTVTYSSELPDIVRNELEALVANIATGWGRDHNPDGSHDIIHATEIQIGTQNLVGSMPTHSRLVRALMTTTRSTGNDLGIFSGISQTGGTTGGPQAILGHVSINAGSTVALAIGSVGTVEQLGTLSGTTAARGVQANVLVGKESTSSIATGTGFHANMVGRVSGGAGTGVISTAVAFEASFGSTGITTKYALRCTDSAAIISHAGSISAASGSTTGDWTVGDDLSVAGDAILTAGTLTVQSALSTLHSLTVSNATTLSGTVAINDRITSTVKVNRTTDISGYQMSMDGFLAIYGGAGSLLSLLHDDTAGSLDGFTIQDDSSLGLLFRGVASSTTTTHARVKFGLYLTETLNTATPTQDTEVAMYMRGDKFIIAFNNGGTAKYRYLDLTSTDATWTYTTTAPT